MANLSLVILMTVILGAAFVGGFLAKKLRQPPVLGYILAGVCVGILGSRLFPEKEAISALAEIGVALLMFVLGLEVSFSRLRKVGEVAFWGGMIQILTVIVLSILIFGRLGFDFYSSLFIGCAFALSSTAIVIKLLSERGEIDTLPGEIMLGWLLVQDLAVLPMVVILPVVGSSGVGWGLLGSVLKAAVFLIAILFLGRKVVPILIARVADFGSRELLLLAVVALCLLTALSASSLGLSLALGAFLAGLIVAETSENHAVFSEIRPLRDLFSIIFFISIGMFLRPEFFLANFLPIVLATFFVIFIKVLVVTALVLYLGYHTKTAIIVGMGLIQVGEFAFVLARLGITHNLVDERTYSLILSVALLTILLTPWFIQGAPKIYLWLRRTSQRRLPKLYYLLFTRYDHRQAQEELPLADHVVICGHGRVGSWLGRALQLLEVPYIVIDYNHQLVEELKEKGINALYGDPADIDVLDYAQVDKARTVVIAIPDQATQELVVAHCQTLNRSAKIISRIHHQEDQKRLKALGVTAVIQPEFEASIAIIRHVLHYFGVEKDEVTKRIRRLKIEHGMG